MFWAARFLLLYFAVLPFANSPYAAASENSRSGTTGPSSQLEEARVVPTPEAVELEEPALHYQFTIVQRAVQVARYGAYRRSASVRVRVESSGNPEIRGHKAVWTRGLVEWGLASANGALVLTAIAGEGGESPSDIVLRFEGARSLSLDALGNLVITTDSGDLHQQHPAVFNASAAPVASRYVLLGGNRVAVEVRTQHANALGDIDAYWAR